MNEAKPIKAESSRSSLPRLTWLDGLFWVTAVAIFVDLYLIFLWVPKEAIQGNVQRIFYFHVPAAWIAYLAFFLVFLFGIIHLRTRKPRWDHYAYSAAQFGVVFTSVTLVTGIIWAKPIFGVWWVWDARLTTTALLWLVYVGYLMVGAYAVSPDKASRPRSCVRRACPADPSRPRGCRAAGLGSGRPRSRRRRGGRRRSPAAPAT